MGTVFVLNGVGEDVVREHLLKVGPKRTPMRPPRLALESLNHRDVRILYCRGMVRCPQQQGYAHAP